MKYQKTNKISGSWAKASELTGVKKCKIVSEATAVPSTFFNKDGSVKNQDVAKVKFEGKPDTYNVSLNRATINGLIEAYGEDSVGWQGHTLSVETEKMRVGGKAVTALYLIPDGFKRIDDENGYAVIVKESEDVPVTKFDEETEEEIDFHL